MPKTVFNQENKFKKDEIFIQLSKENKIKYIGITKENNADMEDIRQTFMQDIKDGYTNITYPESGINLRLCINSKWNDEILNRSDVIYDEKILLQSRFILNGVCVIWKGDISCKTLVGIARIEFDSEMAKQEYNKIRNQLEEYSLIFGDDVESDKPPDENDDGDDDNDDTD